MFKKLLYIGAVVALVAILALVYATYNYRADDANSNTVAQTPTPTKTEEPLQHPGWTRYTEPKSTDYQGTTFSIEYPANLLKQDDNKAFVFLQGLSETDPFLATTFTHEINTEHCALSGVCTPTTNNLTIGFSMLYFGEETLEQSRLEGTSKTQFNNQTVTTLELGAEGEGAVYYFVPLAEDNMLLVYRTYMDENTLIGYKGKPGFLTLAQQKALFNDIIKTIKITP